MLGRLSVLMASRVRGCAYPRRHVRRLRLRSQRVGCKGGMHDKVVGLYRVEKCLLCSGRKRCSAVWEVGRDAQLLALLVELLVIVMVAAAAAASSGVTQSALLPTCRSQLLFQILSLLDDHFQTLLPDLQSHWCIH